MRYASGLMGIDALFAFQQNKQKLRTRKTTSALVQFLAQGAVAIS
jgi:hypothetical protein